VNVEQRGKGKGDEKMSEYHQNEDDELTRRFKAVFNKEPVSRGQTETEWRLQDQDDYEIDDDEVSCSDSGMQTYGN